jgi:flagellum-specific ATP synthase
MDHARLLDSIRSSQLVRRRGEITHVATHVLRARGPDVALGAMCAIEQVSGGRRILAEVVASGAEGTVLMPYGETQGISVGAAVHALPTASEIAVSPAMLGRVLDAFANPIDERGPIQAEAFYPLAGQVSNPMRRARIRDRLHTGIQVIDLMLPIAKGQRVGVFAGSGVGKSTMMGMLANKVIADVTVVALIGERGREVREFIEDRLGRDGLARSIVVVATADQPAVTRARAAHTATAIAEYFRDQGKSVLLMMDSVTRFAMARREIDLAAGQPPTARGYTPSVFSALPALCERAGPGEGTGSISAIYTVLVEGDDHQEPIADTLRATLDGHIWLGRELAQRGVFPAVDILHSVSRLATEIATDDELAAMTLARQAYAAASRNRELVELGLYKLGANPLLDAQMSAHAQLEQSFSQTVHDTRTFEEARAALGAIVAELAS